MRKSFLLISAPFCERRLRHYRQHLQGLAERAPPRGRAGGRKAGRNEARRIGERRSGAPFPRSRLFLLTDFFCWSR